MKKIIIFLKNILNSIPIAGIIIGLLGLYIYIIKGGLPYQDAPEYLLIKQEMYFQSGELLCKYGLAVILVGIVVQIIKTILIKTGKIQKTKTNITEQIIKLLLYGLLLAGILIILFDIYRILDNPIWDPSYVYTFQYLYIVESWDIIDAVAIIMIIIGIVGLISMRIINSNIDNKTSLLLSIAAISALCITPNMIMLYEKEHAEAIAGGLIIGSILGSIFGLMSIITNKERKTIVYILAAIPIVILVIFLMMFIPYYSYK